MVSREQIREWTGLHHATLDKMIRLLESKNIDLEVPDWYTIGQDAGDFADREKAVWDKLSEMYGIEPMKTEKEAGQDIEQFEQEEQDYLIGTKEGTKEILRRIYENKSISPKQKEKLKEKLLNFPENPTLVALYNGKEQDYAKRYLSEMVIAPTRKDVKALLKNPTLKIHSHRGWIKSINGVFLKNPLRSIDFIQSIAGHKLIASDKHPERGNIAVYSIAPPLVITDKENQNKVIAHAFLEQAIQHKDTEKPINDYIKFIDSLSESARNKILEDETTTKLIDKINTITDMQIELNKSRRTPLISIPRKEVQTVDIETNEYCYGCGRLIQEKALTGERKGTTVFFCSEGCLNA